MWIVRLSFLLNALSHTVHLNFLECNFKFCWNVPALSLPVTSAATDTADDGIDRVDDADGADCVDNSDAANDADDTSGDEAATADGSSLGGNFDAAVDGALQLVDIISLGIIVWAVRKQKVIKIMLLVFR